VCFADALDAPGLGKIIRNPNDARTVIDTVITMKITRCPTISRDGESSGICCPVLIVRGCNDGVWHRPRQIMVEIGRAALQAAVEHLVALPVRRVVEDLSQTRRALLTREKFIKG
jgi:hypothetical protein